MVVPFSHEWKVVSGPDEGLKRCRLSPAQQRNKAASTPVTINPIIYKDMNKFIIN